MIGMKQAYTERVSRRSYTNRPVSRSDREKIMKAAAQRSDAGCIRIVPIFEDGSPFTASSGHVLFTGVRNYLVMAGPEADPDLLEKVGYYGESMVLLIQRMGMGSCWVAGTYNRKKVKAALAPGERLVCVIPFGHVKPEPTIREKMLAKTIKRRRKKVRDMLVADGRPENWVVYGVRAATHAPSAMNRQPVRFIYEDGLVSAVVKQEEETDLIDLGIAKLNFEAGAERGHWTFGNGVLYEL